MRVKGLFQENNSSTLAMAQILDTNAHHKASQKPSVVTHLFSYSVIHGVDRLVDGIIVLF